MEQSGLKPTVLKSLFYILLVFNQRAIASPYPSHLSHLLQPACSQVFHLTSHAYIIIVNVSLSSHISRHSSSGISYLQYLKVCFIYISLYWLMMVAILQLLASKRIVYRMTEKWSAILFITLSTGRTSLSCYGI